jgi:ABC-type Zn uptake system ZnuABC Zn-binding protein ZnuA
MYFPEKQLYFCIFLYSLMARKIVLIWTILGLIFIVANYHFLEQKQLIKAQSEITIFTLDALASMHAKMILWENGVVTLKNTKKLSENEKNLLKNAHIVVDIVPLEQSSISSQLQAYQGTYVTIPALSREEILHSPDDLTRQIELIRNAVVAKDKAHPGYYYDNAGNYIHLINNLYETIQNRLSKYHKARFITLGGNFDAFVEKFWLKEYHLKKYLNVREFVSEKWIQELLKKENIRHIFVSFPMTDTDVRSLEQKYNITIYRLPQIEEDLSGWWYLRYLEKVSDKFIQAFDTYD